ncbi:GNAT family N-acetyltransferase, partial [Staphylococcus aureus]|uniref:GNAT family N-acetyltransferase n=1 Tax=Staphylococcus aureus TaxID=1280 RepID=UPI0011A953C8
PKKKHLNPILPIYNHPIINTTPVYTYKPQTIDQPIPSFQTKQPNHDPIFLFDQNPSLLPFPTFPSFTPSPPYQYTIHHSIYLDPSPTPKRIPTQLLHRLILNPKPKPYPTLLPPIHPSNQPTIKLHQNFPFNHPPTLTNLRFKFNQSLHLPFYQLHLQHY